MTYDFTAAAFYGVEATALEGPPGPAGLPGPPGPPDDSALAAVSDLSGRVLPALTPTGDDADRADDLNAASASGNFALTSGHFRLATKPVLTDSAMFSLGAKLTGPQYPQGIADATVTNAAGVWSARVSQNGYANYTHACQLVAYPGGGHTRKFESAAHIASVVVYDNSTYLSDGDGTSPGVELSARDYVGNDASVYVAGGLGLTRTRVWGGNSFVRIGQDASHNGTVDGTATSFEGRIDNWGNNSGEFNTSTQKYVMSAYAGGNRMLTAGYHFGIGAAAGQAGAYYGYSVDGAAVARYAFAVMQIDGVNPQNALWGVLPDGTLEMKGNSGPNPPGAGRVRLFFDSNHNLNAYFDDGVVKRITSKYAGPDATGGLDLPIVDAAAIYAPPPGFGRVFLDSSNAGRLSRKNADGSVTVLGGP